MIHLVYILLLSGFLPWDEPIAESHDIHLSVTELTKVDSDIEVVMKIFFDDLQKAMGLIPGEELPEDYIGSDDLIQRFADDHFILRLNGEKLRLILSETEAALPAIWATFLVKDLDWKMFNELQIENRIMIDLFDDQKNIVKMNLGNKRSDLIFSASKVIETIFY